MSERHLTRRQALVLGALGVGGLTVGGSIAATTRTPPAEPAPRPSPTPTSPPPTPSAAAAEGAWQRAVDSRSYDQVEAWYAAHTGHEALGYAEHDLVAVDGPIESEYDGQVLEGLVGEHIRIRHDDVTVRGCRIVEGGLYGAYYDPTFDSRYTGVTVEYCTFASTSGENVTDAALFLSAEGSPARNMWFHHNNCYGFLAGLRGQGHLVYEYNWIHDFVHPEGSHANSIRLVGTGPGLARRNYCTDGSSGVMSIYFGKEPTANITYEENILDGSSPLAEPAFLINLGSGDYLEEATNIRIIGNYFGDRYVHGIVVPRPEFEWGRGSKGNEFAGNRMFRTGEPFTLDV